jgi:hypothetical protein
LEAAEDRRYTLRELVETGKCLSQTLHARGAAATNDKVAKITNSYKQFEDDIWKKLNNLKQELLSTNFDVSFFV